MRRMRVDEVSSTSGGAAEELVLEDGSKESDSDSESG